MHAIRTSTNTRGLLVSSGLIPVWFPVFHPTALTHRIKDMKTQTSPLLCFNLSSINSLTEGNKFWIQTCPVATGLFPAEIPLSNHYFLLYYIIAALKSCFHIPMQSFSGRSWSRSWMCDYTHTHTYAHNPHRPIMRSFPSESLGRTFWKMEDNPQSVKPWVSQVPIISERICMTPISVSVTQNSLARIRLISGSKCHIIRMPPVYSVGWLVQYDNITFTSEYHICSWVFPDESKVGCYSGSEITEQRNLDVLKS